MNAPSESSSTPPSFLKIWEAVRLLRDRRSLVEYIFPLSIAEIEDYASNPAISQEDRLLFWTIILMKKNGAKSPEDLTAIVDVDLEITLEIEEFVRDITDRSSPSEVNPRLHESTPWNRGFNEIYFRLLFATLLPEQRKAVIQVLQWIGAKNREGEINLERVEEYCSDVSDKTELVTKLLAIFPEIQLHYWGENFFTYLVRRDREIDSEKASGAWSDGTRFEQAIRVYLGNLGDWDSLLQKVDDAMVNSLKRHGKLSADNSTGYTLREVLRQVEIRREMTKHRVDSILHGNK